MAFLTTEPTGDGDLSARDDAIRENFSQIQKGGHHTAASEPDYKVEGTLWYDSTNNLLKAYTGSAWHTCLTSGQVYDSGWFAVATAGSYSKTHGLGTIKFLSTVFWSSDSEGANAEVDNYYEQSGNQYGMQIKTITTTTLKLQAGADGCHATFTDSEGEVTARTSGYARIVLIAVP